MVELGEEALRDAIKTIGLFNTKAKNVIAVRGADPRSWRRGAAHARGAGEAARRRAQDRQCRAQRRLRRGDLRGRHPHLPRRATAPASRRARTRSRSSSSWKRSCPQPFRRDAHHWLILHGRYICKARTPECWRCPVVDLCRYKPKTPPPGTKPSAARTASPRSSAAHIATSPDAAAAVGRS